MPGFFLEMQFLIQLIGESFKKTTQSFLFPETIGFDKLKRKNQLLVDYSVPIDQKGDFNHC